MGFLVFPQARRSWAVRLSSTFEVCLFFRSPPDPSSGPGCGTLGCGVQWSPGTHMRHMETPFGLVGEVEPPSPAPTAISLCAQKSPTLRRHFHVHSQTGARAARAGKWARAEGHLYARCATYTAHSTHVCDCSSRALVPTCPLAHGCAEGSASRRREVKHWSKRFLGVHATGQRHPRNLNRTTWRITNDDSTSHVSDCWRHVGEEPAALSQGNRRHMDGASPEWQSSRANQFKEGGCAAVRDGGS